MATGARCTFIHARGENTRISCAGTSRIRRRLEQRIATAMRRAAVVIEEPAIRIVGALRTARTARRRTSNLNAGGAHGGAHAAASIAAVLPGATNLGATSDTARGTACAGGSTAA